MSLYQSQVRARTRDLQQAAPILERWMRTHVAGAHAIRITDISMPGSAGVANETLILSTEDPAAGARRYIVRVDTPDHLFLGMDLHLHYRLYATLAAEPDIPVPAVLGFEEDPRILGARFFVMAWVDGQVPPDRPNFNYEGWVKDSSVEQQHAMWTNTIRMMVAFHKLDVEKFAFLQRPAKGQSGLEQEMRHWFDYADSCQAETHALLCYTRQWLEDKFPADPPTSPSWGDARLQNIIFRGHNCAAMLDWDMVSLAGPEADLAWWALADHKYTYSNNHPRLPGIGSPAQTMALWEKLSGKKLRHMDWHLVFAAYRQALISIRLPQLTRKMQGLPAENPPTVPASAGLQWLACLLDQPLGAPLTLPFVGLDK